MFIEDTTPIAALTVADLKKLLKDFLREQKIDAIPPVTTPVKRYVYGLKGIQDLFGVCHLTAQRYKDGFLAPACIQNGRKMIWPWTFLRTISMRTLDDIDPIAAITAEIEKAMRAPDRIGIMSVKSANQWVDDALHEPDPKTYFYDLLVEGECTVLFASSNAGKSVLATQMAEAVARENTVLYLDCELSAKQFQMRYVEGNVSPIIHRFPDTLLRAEIRPDDIVDTNLEDAILDSVAVAAEYRGIRHIFVDNITFLLNDSEKGEAAGAFMKKILALKWKYGLTMVIVGHSPKRQPRTPMVQNDLAGSAKLMNFFDAGIAIGRSAKSSELRYIKQVKVRTGLNKYDGEKVLLFKLKQEQGYTQFIYEDTVSEADYLRQKNALTEAEDFQELIDLQAQNKTVREIAAETGFAPTTVHRKIKKALDLGYKPSCSVPQWSGTDGTVK